MATKYYSKKSAKTRRPTWDDELVMYNATKHENAAIPAKYSQRYAALNYQNPLARLQSTAKKRRK